MGTGGIAKKFTTQLAESKRGKLVAVGSRSGESAQRFADQFPCKTWASYEALLEDPEVDAIYISLPNSLHHAWSIKALQAGKHVLCEKPISVNAAEAEEMFDVAAQCGRVLVEAFMYRCQPVVQEILRKVHDGCLGELRIIRTHFTFERPANAADVRYQPALAGGALMDVGSYCINFSRALVGSEPVSAHAVQHKHETGVDDYTVGTLEFANGTLCIFSCGMALQADRTTFLAGSEGHLAVELPWLSTGDYRITRSGETEHFQVPPPQPVYALEADAFAAIVLDNAEPFPAATRFDCQHASPRSTTR